MRVLFAFLALVSSVSAQGLTGPNFYVTGNDQTNSYYFAIDGANVPDPSLSLTVGTTYKFILNGTTLSNHPFGFSSSGDTSAAPSIEDFSSSTKGNVTTSGACSPATNSAFAWFTTSGSESTNPCIISFTPPTNASGLVVYYRCSFHKDMVGMLTAVAAGGSTTSPPTGTTTSPPTGTTTQTPTTPAPTGSSTGKNSAAIILPGAATFIIAAINVIFSA